MNRKIVFHAHLHFEANLTVYSTKLMRIGQNGQIPPFLEIFSKKTLFRK